MARNTEVAVMQRNNQLPLMRPEAGEDFVTPSVDVYETAEMYVVMMDIPGAAKDAIHVWIEQGSLVVKAPVAPYHEEKASLLHNELPNRNYYRAFNLGDGVDPSKVEAQFENGVLTVRLHKTEQRKPREIKIQ